MVIIILHGFIFAIHTGQFTKIKERKFYNPLDKSKAEPPKFLHIKLENLNFVTL